MRARLATFGQSYDEAVLHQSQVTVLEPEADLRATRAAARRGLEQFDPKDHGGFGLALAPGDFGAGEVEVITARYYELALILADRSRHVLQATDQRTGLQPEWFWRLREAVPSGMTVAVVNAGELTASAAAVEGSPEVHPAAERVLSADGGRSDVIGPARESPQPVPTTDAPSRPWGWVIPFGETVMIASMVLAWKAQKRRRADRAHPTGSTRSALRRPPSPRFLNASKSLGSRPSGSRDLPPWLTASTGGRSQREMVR